jgi:anaerobic magnesium-protoporphyrin IX monomethyl ester cyclase
VSLTVLLVYFTDPPRRFSTSAAALAAVVRRAGHRPATLEVVRTQNIEEVAEEIDRIAPDVLGLCTMTRDWPGASTLVSRVHSESFVVVGGYHASLAPHDVARCPGVDAICIGEGERPLRGLLDTLAAGKLPTTSPGLWVRERDGWTTEPPPADPEPDIAALPWWDYDVFGSVERILDGGVNTFGPHADRYLPTRAGRGCPFTCSYCSAPRWGKLQGFAGPGKRNVRPVAHLCAELEALRDRHAPDGFEFWDEHFPIRIEWLRELALEYPRRVGLPFKVEMHPSAASRQRLELLREAGCVLFHCGIESGDEQFRRDVLDRRTPDATLQRVFDDCRALGMQTSASLMTMLPGETRAHMRSTLDLLHRLQPGSFMWSNYHPLPATVLGDAAVQQWPGPARETFDDYDAVAMLTPPRVDAFEREQTFRELTELQAQLVQIATRRDGADTSPHRARPIEIPPAKRPASPALAAHLGLAPPDAAPSRARAKLVSFERDVLTLEVEHPAFATREIQLARRGTSRHFIETAKLGLSYRGREAPPELLALLREIADALADTDIEMLRNALD